MTNGSYVLMGSSTVRASEAAPAAAPANASGATAVDTTMTDTSPTLADTAPTLPTAPAVGDTVHGAAPSVAAGNSIAAAGVPAGAVAVAGAAVPADCSTKPAPAAPLTDAAHAPPPGTEVSVLPGGCPTPADAVASQEDALGAKTPLSDSTGASLTANAVLARLSQRRTELDTREQDLNMRAALVDAAQKKLEERTAALQMLEDQVTAQDQQKNAKDDSQLTGIVSMYETMKPADAAAIFDNLDMAVLSRVVKLMNPRKMAPILAKMTAARAQELTVKLALDGLQTAAPAAQGNLAALPQIVGQ